MNNEGWIKIHRKFLEWQWYSDINTKVVFLHLLLSANYEPKKWLEYTIDRGQVVVGRKALSESLNLSEQQIRTAFKKLESSGNITTKSTNRFTIVTICNYDKYQQVDNDEQPTEQPTINQQITNNQPTDNHNIRNKEIKKERIEEYSFKENIKRKSKQEREDEFRNKVADIANGQYTQDMIDRFCDYWTESNEGENCKLKFEMQKTFDIARRLVTWSKNNFKNNGNFRNTTEQKSAEQRRAETEAIVNIVFDNF